MSNLAMLLMAVFEIVLVSALLLITPRLTRRGLLFGVYVGEDASEGAEAARLKRSFQVGVGATTAGALIVAVVVIGAFGIPLLGFATLVILTGFTAAYLRAHFKARGMATSTGRPPAAAALIAVPPDRLLLPVIACAIGVAGGLFAVGYAWMHYGLLPERVPAHFDFWGAPDHWVDRSAGAVFIIPITTLCLGPLVGLISLLVAGAKVAIRLEGGDASLRAQERFRSLMTRFMALTAIFLTAMLVTASVHPIRVALGRDVGLHQLASIASVAGLLVCVIGAGVAAIRVGQGGACLEASVGSAPLTNGLADNRYWCLGMFYVNRDDPSIFVEKRFGLGYTINLGHWKGVVLLATMILVPVMLALSAAHFLS